MTRVLVSIDPGLDRAAAAIWDTTDWNGSVHVGDQAKRLRGVYQCKTPAQSALPGRLAQLCEWAWHLSGNVRALLNVDVFAPLVHQPIVVIIEWPAFHGLYAGRSGPRSRRVMPNATAMAGLYVATGAILAGVSGWCAPDKIVLEPARKVDREMKQMVAGKCLDAATLGVAKSPNNDDIRSAVYIGMATEWRA